VTRARLVPVVALVFACSGAEPTASEPAPPTPPPTPPPVTLAVTNALIYPADVLVNTRLVGTVAASQATTLTVPREFLVTIGNTTVMVVVWAMVRPTLNGQPLGDAVNGLFPAVSNPAGNYQYNITAAPDSYRRYFAPLITNSTSVPLLMGVNMSDIFPGPLQRLCNCLIPAFTSRVDFGYYVLIFDILHPSNVRAYKSNSNYTGPYLEWVIPPSSVTQPSGVVLLQATTPP